MEQFFEIGTKDVGKNKGYNVWHHSRIKPLIKHNDQIAEESHNINASMEMALNICN